MSQKAANRERVRGFYYGDGRKKNSSAGERPARRSVRAYRYRRAVGIRHWRKVPYILGGRVEKIPFKQIGYIWTCLINISCPSAVCGPDGLRAELSKD